ncbi:30S ribosomal protein S9 [Candidatus Micrarchaeota archaeon]|nr:30S ribosomal protein S9 [Candidatus Micrarchaeota archaeon]
MITRGKRKESIARAIVQQGKGVIRINNFALETVSNEFVREIISEPLVLVGDLAKTLDINVNVLGGGPIGQAQAARTAIARAILKFSGDKELEKKFLDYDRHLLKEDPRRVEPKKYKGPKARARFQKSYR